MAPESDQLLDLLGSEVNRRVLALTSEEPRSAEEIAERCEASLPTVYRHIDDLRTDGLLHEQTRYDQRGNHFKTYEAALEAVSVRVADGEVVVDAEWSDSDRPETYPD